MARCEHSTLLYYYQPPQASFAVCHQCHVCLWGATAPAGTSVILLPPLSDEILAAARALAGQAGNDDVK